jgi:hypothetical protein
MSMRRSVLGGLCLALALSAAACEPDRPAERPAAQPSPSASDALMKHQQIWMRVAPTSYDFVLTYGSQLGPRAARVRVTDGRVVSASPIKGQARFLPGTDKARTLDGLFELLRRDLSRADKVTVTYDDTWGFPSSASVDPDRRAVDEEHAYSVAQFRVLSR